MANGPPRPYLVDAPPPPCAPANPRPRTTPQKPMQIDEQELWARLGKQAVELELLRAEIARLTAELEKRVKEQDGKS